MGAFDRFRRLERPRPERGGPPRPADESVAERFGQPEIPPDPSDAAPLNCAKCGGDNPARSATCFNCGADLDTDEMRAHQIAWRARFAESQKRAQELREARKREAEAYAERELAKARTKAASQSAETPSTGAGDLLPGSMPLGWLLRATRAISDPGLRLGVQIAIVAAVVGLVGYGISSPSRYGLLILVGILLGGGMGGRRYRRWWW
jgi:hypothetical protein